MFTNCHFKIIDFQMLNEGKVLKLRATGYDLQTLTFQPTTMIFKLSGENLDSLNCGPLTCLEDMIKNWIRGKSLSGRVTQILA